MYGNETVDTFTEVFTAASVADKTALQVGNGFVMVDCRESVLGQIFRKKSEYTIRMCVEN